MSLYRLLIALTILPYIFAINPFLQTVSKAFEKSTKLQYNLLFDISCFSTSVFNMKILLDVLIFGLKPDRCG